MNQLKQSTTCVMRTRFFIVIAVALVLGSGCSGINASKSVSPLDFILPGLMHNSPSTPRAPSVTNEAPLLAATSDLLLLPVSARFCAAEPQDQAIASKIQTAPSIASYDPDRNCHFFPN